MNYNKIMKRRMKESKKIYKQLIKDREKETKIKEEENPVRKLKRFHFSPQEKIKFLEKEREELEKEYDIKRKRIKEIGKKEYFKKATPQDVLTKFELEKESEKIEYRIEIITNEISSLIKEEHQLEY